MGGVQDSDSLEEEAVAEPGINGSAKVLARLGVFIGLDSRYAQSRDLPSLFPDRTDSVFI